MLDFLRPRIFNSSLRGSQTGDGHTEGRAGHVVQAHLVAELHAGGVAAVLAADAQAQVGTGGAAQLRGHLDQLAYALLVQVSERIALVDLVVVVVAQELARVVTAEAEGHLGQIVGAEAEELGLLGDLVGGQGRARDLDHGAHLVLHLHAGVRDQLVGGGHDHVLDKLQLLDLANQRDHDVGNDLQAGLLGDIDGGVDDSGGLHLSDLRVGDSQTAAAVTHHRVELMQAVDHVVQLFHADLQILGQIHDLLFLGGQELVQRRIQVTHGHRALAHDLVHGLEVTLLVGQDLGQGLLAVLHGLGHDHLAHGLDAVGLKEHMLGTAQADALGAEVHALLGVARVVGVGEDLQLTGSVGPAHEAAEVAADGGVHGGDSLSVDVAGGAVNADPVAPLVGLAGQGELLLVVVHHDVAAAGHAAGAHAAGHHGGVAGHTAAHGQDALGHGHTLDILGAGLQTDQNHLGHGAVLHALLGVLGGEDHLAAGSARAGGQALADDLGGLQGGGVKLGMQQAVQLLGLHAQHGLAFVDHALVHQVDGDLQGGGGSALAVTGLQHIQLAILDGELHILHILVVVLQLGGDLHKLVINLGHLLLQMGDGERGADTGHHVLALGVDQVLTEQGLLAGGGVAGEGNAGAAGLAAVAEHHGLHVDGGAPVVGDLVHAAVDVGAGVVPAAEHGLDGLDQLNLRVRGEVAAHLGLVQVLELHDQSLHVVGVQLGVHLDALGFLHLVDDLLEVALAQLHDHVAEHLDETAVAVVGETGVAGLGGQTLDHLVVQAQVQDGVHHAGHGGTGAGTHRHQQGVGHVTELLAGDLLHLADVFVDVGHDLLVDLAAVVVILGAGLGADGEALGHRHAGVGHLGQVRALAAQDLAHVLIAFAEQIKILLLAQISLPPKNVGFASRAQHAAYQTDLMNAPILYQRTGRNTRVFCRFAHFFCSKMRPRRQIFLANAAKRGKLKLGEFFACFQPIHKGGFHHANRRRRGLRRRPSAV